MSSMYDRNRFLELKKEAEDLLEQHKNLYIEDYIVLNIGHASSGAKMFSY